MMGGGGWKSLFRLESLPFVALILLSFLSPLFFLSSVFIPIQFSKTVFLAVGAVTVCCLFIIATLKRGSVEVPISWQYLAVLSVPVVVVVSALLSSVPSMSLAGYGYEIDTAESIFFLFVVLGLTAILFQNGARVLYGQAAFYISTILVLAFHLIRLFAGPSVLSFGMFMTAISSITGSWYDFGIISGALVLLSCCALEMLPLSRKLKMVVGIAGILALVFLFVVYLSVVWVALAVVCIIFFVYSASVERVANDRKEFTESGEVIHIAKQVGHARKLSVLALIVAGVACISLLPLGKTLSGTISNSYIGISYIEGRPSWSTSLDISKAVIKDHPVFGAGPARFSSQWQLFKPTEVNMSPFWATDFTAGIGFVPTFLATTGIVGFLAWLAFLAVFVYMGLVALSVREEHTATRYAIISSFLVSLYFWILLVCYIPGTAVIVSAFFFTGLFFATLHRKQLLRSKTILFSSYPRAAFAITLGLVLVLVAVAALGYLSAQKVVATYYLNKSAESLASGDIETSDMFAQRALMLDQKDAYYRIISNISISRLGAIVSRANGQTFSDELLGEFRRVLTTAIEASNKAIEVNREDYVNWVSLGKVYEAITPLKVEQAYESARAAYEEAIKRSPNNPQLTLRLARLEAARGDIEKAKEYVAQAISQKSDYSEAIFFRSQIEVAEGNIRGAINSMENITLISPTDAGAFFELGLLKYNNKDYAGAIVALERSISLLPEYANARYFLGLSYAMMNRRAEAITQFKTLSAQNPDNAELGLILTNLTEGRGPFTNAEPPIDDKPEKRKSLPLEDR